MLVERSEYSFYVDIDSEKLHSLVMLAKMFGIRSMSARKPRFIEMIRRIKNAKARKKIPIKVLCKYVNNPIMAYNNDTVVLESDDNHHHVKINDANKDGNNYNRVNLMLGLPTRKSLTRNLINLIWNHFLLGLVTLKNINEDADNGVLVGSPQVVQEIQIHINVDLVFENVDDINSILAEVQQDMKILDEDYIYWNISDISNSPSKLAFKRLCYLHKPGFFFIVDPWMSHIDFRAKLLVNLQYKLFSFNNRDDLLHNMWGICDNQINHIVIAMLMVLLYASTTYISRMRL